MCAKIDKELKPPSPLDNLNFFSNDIQWNKLCEDLDKRLNSNIGQNHSPDEKLDAIMKAIVESSYHFVPAKKTAMSSKTHIPRHRCILMRKRRKITIKLNSTPL